MKLIGMQLQGGLCNAMFQIATIESLGGEYGMDVCYPNAEDWMEYLAENYEWTSHAREYLDVFPNVNLFKNIDKSSDVRNIVNIPFRYKKIVPEVNDCFFGYFQSEKNFTDKAFISWLFEPSDAIKDACYRYNFLFTEDTCSIHVRRGNYLSLPDHHPVLTMDYYKKAIWSLESLNVDRFIVFSDDIEWCKENFKGHKYYFIKDTDYVELFLMNRCTHHILSNSSFSWWGAWLSEVGDTVVVAPSASRWFGKALPSDYSKDIIPERWIKF
jgi:hypothetical protein